MYKFMDPKYSSSPEGDFIFFHYTYASCLPSILHPKGGLHAFRPLSCPRLPSPLRGRYVVEGFLEPSPRWWTESPYFGDLGQALVKKYLGRICLKVQIPLSLAEVFIADFAHILEVKHANLRKKAPLSLGYDLTTGRDATQGFIRSFVPVKEYRSLHLCPVVQVCRKGAGQVIPPRYIQLSGVQPFSTSEG